MHTCFSGHRARQVEHGRISEPNVLCQSDVLVFIIIDLIDVIYFKLYLHTAQTHNLISLLREINDSQAVCLCFQ